MIIQFYAMDGEKRTVLNIGCCRIVGELDGEKTEISGILSFIYEIKNEERS